MLPPPPRNTARPSIVPLGDHTYRCDPGTWEGKDPARPYTFTWQRLTRDTSALSGYRVDTVATGETYRAATEKQFDLLNASWLFQCVVRPPTPVASTSATSPSLKLDPVYDPGLELPPPGNFRVRGIDVFQVVQPNAGAVTWDDPVAGAFAVECGGGTPTSWELIQGVCSLGLEPPRFKRYKGVELDARKPATAIVYVDMADAAPGQKLEVSLRLIRQGKPWDVPLRATITPPPAAGTPFVTAAERGDRKRGVPFVLPAYWLCCTGGDRIDLKATVAFPKVFGQQPRQCASGCTDDDRYTLWGLPLVTAPPVRVESVDLRKVGIGAVDTWSAPPGTLLQRARQVYPGGEGWSVFSSGATIDIKDVLGWTIDSPQCALLEGPEPRPPRLPREPHRRPAPRLGEPQPRLELGAGHPDGHPRQRRGRRLDHRRDRDARGAAGLLAPDRDRQQRRPQPAADERRARDRPRDRAAARRPRPVGARGPGQRRRLLRRRQREPGGLRRVLAAR